MDYFLLPRRLAGSFFLRLTLGFSKCSWRRASVRTPSCWAFLLKRFRAASKVSFSPTMTSYQRRRHLDSHLSR